MIQKKRIKQCLSLLEKHSNEELNSIQELLVELINEEVMDSIDSAISPIEDYCFSIVKNTEHDHWELNIGIPTSWQIEENKNIAIEIKKKSDFGKEIVISPKNDKIRIDDLVLYLRVIIETNREIEEKQQSFIEEMEKIKQALKDKASRFYEDLETDKKEAFKKLNKEFAQTSSNDVAKNKDKDLKNESKRGRKKTTKPKE